MSIEKTGRAIVNLAIKVFRAFGPGLLESGYQKYLRYEVEKLAPIHEAQLSTYLKISQIHLGFLLNWNVHLMKDANKTNGEQFVGLKGLSNRSSAQCKLFHFLFPRGSNSIKKILLRS